MKPAVAALALLLSLVPAASAQDGGKISWKGKGGVDPRGAIADAHQQNRPMMLFFTSLGCKYCKEISEGAFSDPKVVEASDRLQCIFVDCNWGKNNTELSDAYGVKGYPTVVFCDPDAKPISVLSDSDSAAVIKKMTEVADKFGSKPVYDVPVERVTGMSFPDAKAESLRTSKPIAYLFYDDSPPSQALTKALADPSVKRVLGRFVLALCPYKKDSDECVKYGVNRSPMILILDPKAARPEEKPLATIAGSKSPRELVREFEAVAPAGAPETATAPPTPGGTSAPRVPEEKLSNDELERKFIQARIGIALETLKKGQKAKAIGILEDVVASYPKHVETQAVKKLLEDLKK